MICPNCRESLRRTERAGSICVKCTRPFALDPKVHGPGMHDLRIRRIAERATDSGRRKVTLTQLGYLARTAHRTWPGAPERGRKRWIGCSTGLLLAAGLVPLAVAVRDLPAGGLVWVVGLVLVVVGYRIARGQPYQPAQSAGAGITPTTAAFGPMMRYRWIQAYGALPAGIVDEERYAARRKAGPGAVQLLCTDLAVRVFLAANGVPGRWGFTLVADLDQVSGRVPVVVLHDAGARGLRLVAEVRERWPGQVVVDAGMPVRAVRGNRRAVVLHEAVDEWFSHLATERLGHSSTAVADRLSHSATREGERPSHSATSPPTPDWLSHLTTEEVQWLSQGWYSPLAAAPPALLESAVVRAVRQAGLSPLGFMSWPASEKDGN
ncbi:hypothetical protein [Streptomyces sp. 4F14]|uniref:hypothetical protein n=1 Tax=Streptomyces sp. 4F14 TaxID=3394380 RepID=UPI003A84F63D